MIIRRIICSKRLFILQFRDYKNKSMTKKLFLHKHNPIQSNIIYVKQLKYPISQTEVSTPDKVSEIFLDLSQLLITIVSNNSKECLRSHIVGAAFE